MRLLKMELLIIYPCDTIMKFYKSAKKQYGKLVIWYIIFKLLRVFFNTHYNINPTDSCSTKWDETYELSDSL